MSLIDKNEALQKATREHNWVYWRMDDVYLANSYASVRLGHESEDVEVLLCRMKKAEKELDALCMHT